MLNDVHITELKRLRTPDELAVQLPLTAHAINTVLAARLAAQKIIHGHDDRLLVIVGPCSIHHPQSAIEYGRFLKSTMARFTPDLHLIMRTYFEKPRTRTGWKGLIHDPQLDGSAHIHQGLFLARELLLNLNNQSIPTATEFLDTLVPQFISDLISWGAIGARTTESQIHRELASGLSMPVGFKNNTEGHIEIAIDAVCTAKATHHFLGMDKKGQVAVIQTTGNPDCHVVLRGGRTQTNYDAQSIEQTVAVLKKRGLPPGVMVDCSHDNSFKQYANQISVAACLAQQIAAGNRSIIGIMLESHLQEGKQAFQIGQQPHYAKSITDACLSWEQTENILVSLADAVQQRRNR